MFIRKSQYKRYKDWALSDQWRARPELKAFVLRIGADRYREKALSGENVAENITTSIRMIKTAMVCERLSKVRQLDG
jgi:hypothetical protein